MQRLSYQVQHRVDHTTFRTGVAEFLKLCNFDITTFEHHVCHAAKTVQNALVKLVDLSIVPDQRVVGALRLLRRRDRSVIDF